MAIQRGIPILLSGSPVNLGRSPFSVLVMRKAWLPLSTTALQLNAKRESVVLRLTKKTKRWLSWRIVQEFVVASVACGCFG